MAAGAPIVVLVVAAAIAVAGDLAYVVMPPADGPFTAAVTLWAAAVATLAVTPWAGHVDIFASAAPRRRPVAMTPLPLVFVGLALGVSAYAATAAGGKLDPLSAGIGCLVLIAPVVQLVLVQRENTVLYGDLVTQAAGFRSMLQESNDVVMTCTLDGVVRYATPSLVHVLGYEPSQIEGTPLADLVHPDDLHAVQSRFAAMFADDQQGVSVQGRVRAADGSWRHLESTVSAFRRTASSPG
jgi:PAS domain S-box-containing protein